MSNQVKKTNLNKSGIIVLIGILLVVIAVGSASWYIYTSKNRSSDSDSGSGSYSECVSKNNPVLQTYPSVCKDPSGKTFIDPDDAVTQPGTGTAP